MSTADTSKRQIASRKAHMGINEFLALDHMEIIPESEIVKPPNEVYYLAHHCVFKEDSTTTKLRVVFDGSA